MSISMIVGKLGLFMVQHRSTIYTAAGVASMGAGAIAAGVKSLRFHEEVTEPALTKICELEAANAEPKTIKKEKYMLLLTTARRYALPIALVAGGAALVFIGHGYALKQIAGLSSALAFVQEDNKRLKALLDEAAEAEDIETVKMKLDDAEVKKTVDKVKAALPEEDYNNWSFSSTNPNFDPSAIINDNFLEMVERLMNDKLAVRGHVFLNEVYDALGMPRTKYGAVMGWVDGGDPIEFDPDIRREPDGSYWYELHFNPDTNLIAG